MAQRHVLLVTFPAQGHINPCLQFAKRLIRMGIYVTFMTSTSALRRMNATQISNLDGLSFAQFSDGYDDGFKPGDDVTHFMSEIRRCSSQTLAEVITSSSENGRPITYLVYSIMLPWAPTVARELHIPSVLLWIQPAIVLDIYYYYFNGFGDVIKNKITNTKDPSCLIELPKLPFLTIHDLPSFLIRSDSNNFVLPLFQEHIGILAEEKTPKVLVNTFTSLEPDALSSINELNLVGIGPLIPSAFLDGKDTSDNSFGGDLIKPSSSDDEYIKWLNSKPESSVIYVSFGSLIVLSKRQMKELEKGLLETGKPFLWVIRETQQNKEEEQQKKEEEEEEEEEEEDKNKLSLRRELLDQLGMIVTWCSQVEVLSHPSIGCFVTHSGWNSTLESLVSGVPMVMFPQWSDQGTNAMLVERVWKMGVRLAVNKEEEEEEQEVGGKGGGLAEGEEIKRCLEMVMGGGERGEEMRRNAEKWKELAKEAVKEGGSSDKNLKDFVGEIANGVA